MSDETKEPGKRTPRRRASKSEPSKLSEETKDGEDAPFNLDLRTKDTDEVLHPDAQRFNFFLIDTGWHESVSQMVHKHFPRLLHHHNPKDSLFILTPEQSVEVLRQAPYEIGHDPIILVYDLYAPSGKDARSYKGFRLALGLIRHPEQAMARLQEFFRFLVIHRSSTQLDREIRRNLRREGFEGMVKVLRESTTEVL
jgi:hypothetical protein